MALPVSLSYEELLREKDERIHLLEIELGARTTTDTRFGMSPTVQASSAVAEHGMKNLPILQVSRRKRPPGFIEVSFDTETNRPVKKPRIGQGRQGKLTKEGLETLKQVKKAGGQCIRCKTLKKKCDGGDQCWQCRNIDRSKIKPGSRWDGLCRRERAPCEEDIVLGPKATGIPKPIQALEAVEDSETVEESGAVKESEAVEEPELIRKLESVEGPEYSIDSESSQGPEEAECSWAELQTESIGAHSDEYSRLSEESTRHDVDLRNLELAVSQGNEAAVRLYLDGIENGIPSGVKDQDSSLCLAAQFGYHQIITLLVDHGFNIDQDNSIDRRTPLHLAVLLGLKKVTEVILDLGANANVRDRLGMTPLHVAAQSQYLSLPDRTEVLQMLLRAGCNVNAINAHQETPLHLAAQYSHPESFQMLLDAGSNINARDAHQMTALHYASMLGNEKAVHKLLDAGSDVNARDDNLRTALLLTFKLPVIRVLLKYGADFNLEARNGYDALALAVTEYGSDEEDTSEVVKLILDFGALVNKRYRDGRTILMRAIIWGSVITVRLLLNHKDIDVHLRDDCGRTALDLARRRITLGGSRHEGIVELLENHIRKETLLSTPLLLQPNSF